MGMDIVCIIENKYPKEEIINIQSEIDSWSEIQNFVINYRKSKNINYKIASKISRWEYDKLDIESLEKIWLYQENKGKIQANIFIGINRLSNFYCDIKFNRKTIMISPSPEHKYSNLHQPETAEYIIKLIRMIAGNFGQKEIIYCVDSAYPPAHINSEAIEGKSFKELKEVGLTKFGNTNIDLNQAMKNLFFVDNCKNEIPKTTQWNWLNFKYAKE